MAMQVQSICGVGRAIEVSFDVEIEIGALVHENGEVKNVAILDDMNDAMVSLRAQSTSADLTSRGFQNSRNLFRRFYALASSVSS